MTPLQILIVDDEKEIADLIEIHLLNENYKVYKLYESTKVLDTLKDNDISLAILDIMMPGIDGLELCQRIRAEYNIPIIMLSAKSQDMDKIIGLSNGADDYIAKPFNPIELIARVKAQLRRYIKLNPDSNKNEQDANAPTIEHNGLIINKESHTVTLYGKRINLTRREFDILYLLACNPGKVFNSEDIFKSVWKEKYYEASNNTIMVHIMHLRSKMEDSSKSRKFIKTVWGVGYKFE
jgi:DNA-binding response OmpR family regulator